MTDFQVGDRVSVEGVVTAIEAESSEVQVLVTKSQGERWYNAASLTLIERPKRKLRVGSVWEVRPQEVALYSVRTSGPARYTVVAEDLLVSSGGAIYRRNELSIDGTRETWREVPVAELEAEARG